MKIVSIRLTLINLSRGLLFCVLYCSVLPAQSLLPVHELGVSKGLFDHHNAYFDLDKSSYFFTSSASGLYRFDGLNSKNYRIPTKDNLVTSSVFRDAIGRLWFSTSSGIHTIGQDTVHTWPLLQAQGYISIFHLERDSFLWLTAGESIFVINVFKDFSKTPAKFRGKGFINYPWVDNNGRMKGIVRPFFNSTKGVETSRFQKNGTIIKDTIAEQNGELIRYLEIESDSLFWLPGRNGLIEINPHYSGRNLLYKHDASLRDVSYTDIEPYGIKYLLVASKAHGLLLFNKEHKRFEKQFTHYYDDKRIKPFGTISRIYVDRFENLWISELGKNLWHVNLKNQKFHELFPPTFLEEREDFTVNKVIEIGRDSLLSLVNGEDLFRLIRQQNNTYRLDEIRLPGRINERIVTILRDSHQNWWIATNNSLFLLDQELKKIKKSIQSNSVLEIEEISDDTIVVMTNTNVFLISKSNIPERLSDLRPLEIEGNYLEQCHYDPFSKRLFISYDGSYLQVFDFNKKTAQPLGIINEIGIISGLTRSLHPDTLLLSSNAGLYKYCLSAHQSEIVNDKTNNLNQSFESISMDTNGLLWLGTTNGLIRVNLKNRESRIFNRYDGMYTTLYEDKGVVRLENGTIIFYGKNGATIVNPNTIQLNDNCPKVVLEEIRVENEIVKEEPFLDAQHYPKLHYSQNDLSFKFSAIEYSDPENNQLICLLIKTNNKDTISIIRSLNPVFPSLSSGKYELQVYPINSDGVAFPKEKMCLFFKINPPWYFSTLAIISYILLSIGAVLGAFYYLDRQKTIKYEREKEVLKLSLLESEQKLRLLDHHMISNIFYSITQGIKEDKVDLAQWYSKQASRFYRRYLDINEEYAIDLTTEKKYIEEYIALKERLYDYRFKGSFEIAEDIDPDDTLIPTFLTQIFVENAVKYAFPANRLNGELLVRISKQEDLILCEIEDNGIGRQQSEKYKSVDAKHNSKGIQFTKERLAIIETQTGLPTHFEIIDMEDETGNPCGTKVLIAYPIDFDLNARF